MKSLTYRLEKTMKMNSDSHFLLFLVYCHPFYSKKSFSDQPLDFWKDEIFKIRKNSTGRFPPSKELRWHQHRFQKRHKNPNFFLGLPTLQQLISVETDFARMIPRRISLQPIFANFRLSDISWIVIFTVFWILDITRLLIFENFSFLSVMAKHNFAF